MSNESNGGSRRDLLKKAAGLTGLAAAAAFSTPAAHAAGMSKASVKYQDKPKDGHQCDGCALWIPGASPTANGKCKAVSGSISPKGWCTLWSPKSA
ncbi:MAG TPA: high-potential iron-sulfur protein [Acetobacteraceae bacterium]|nr:high-potential iron-sulfur protein [Acetobacteraceae bacterium]